MKSPIEDFAKHVESRGGHFDDSITPWKIRDRGQVVQDPDHPGRAIVEVERHRAILGDVYHRGQPMDVMRTYYPRYGYDPATGEWEPLGEARKPEIEVKFRRAAEIVDDTSFTFEDLGGGQYRCRETMTGEERTVESKSDMEQMARDIVNGFDYSYLDDELSDALSPAELNDFKVKLRQAEQELVTRKAREAWEDRDLY